MFSESGDYVVGSVQDVKDAVRDCAASDFGLTVAGGGQQQHVGHPPSRSCRFLQTSLLNSVVEYNPEDLVVVADAGMTLSALQETLARSDQWLPIEIPSPDKQTLGGIVATRANSHLRAGYGSVRDWLIGVEVVNSRGDMVVGGGKVVKNVAGYDLPKLYCGSWGTLGVLTKTNFKVAPLPESDRALLIVLSSKRNSEELIDALLAGTQAASTILFNGDAAKRLLGDDALPAQYLFVRFLGFREVVDAQIATAAGIAEPFATSVIALPGQISTSLAALLRDFPLQLAPLSARYHILSSQVGAYARMVEWIAARTSLTAEVVSDAATGIVYANFYEQSDYVDWVQFIPLFQDKADRVGGSLIVERMPDSWKDMNFPVWSPILPDHVIMKLIKKKLDPDALFNPGRFMGGI